MRSTQHKRPFGDVSSVWVAKSASYYINDPQKCTIWFGTVCKWMIFPKCFPNLSQNCFKFKKIFKILVISFQISPQNGPIGI